MKVILGIFAAFAVTQSFANVAPNMYVCDGKDAQVHYTTTSKAGKPTFGATVRGEKAKLPAFPELKVENTLAGTIVTARDFSLTLVDGPERRYSLVLPYVSLEKQFGSTKFETVLIKSSAVNPLFGPRVDGPAIHSEFIPVECEASFVMF